LYLAGENPDEPLPAASTANIMTALVVLEEGTNPDEEVMISEQAESYVGTTYSNVGLIWGERLSIRDLLAATLIPSGTDAAYSLAEHVGGGSVENFVGMMNDKASELGLQNTRFEDPAGLEPTGNYSSSSHRGEDRDHGPRGLQPRCLRRGRREVLHSGCSRRRRL
jgi:D-alanyl-D-alanine carboxypeptidase